MSRTHPRHPPLQNRIIGGENAQLGEFPFVVALWSDMNNSPYIVCGGSIISAHFVLTAAHCVDDYNPKLGYYYIQAGIVNWEDKGVRYNVTKVIGHPNYDAEGDIALLKVAGPIKFTDNIRPVGLPKATDYLKGGEAVEAVGWGATNTDPATYPKILHKVVLTVVSYEECTKQISSAPSPYDQTVLNATMVCAGKPKGGVCYGDSGSGLVRGANLVGIVSFGVPCGIGYPDVYTRVSSLVPWVHKQIKANS
ncbi:chymotrypsin-1-like isoform X3 [Bacillus rossius redtenbacheri]|uniref:chymotrypsin-1-like isoform X3 n=1 Tax=Bacillus rossius redtenbacheri TaxID=93214 RepID=UPI002FDE64C4